MLLDAEPGAASRARHWVVDRATEAGVPGVDLAVIELLSGELIANGIRHGPTRGSVEVETGVDGDRFGVFVFDQTAQPPRVLHPGPTATNGRGLELVEALSSDWGYVTTGPASKAVWFYLAVLQREPLPAHSGPGLRTPATA